ncbi:protein-disulfide isomerase [Arthrobacter pigmenti]|uniref:Protein-disulfide isomerase n=1 Tax=Arthrobacter pigmenti TaxID=271432 RepID=A0A846RJD5_9MICC|nr:DsbA family protein [Arthrobacter pigmenti]NJC21279.1 protein-disulfide isomerase [Arthrobacter pigmenti]
MTPNNSQPSKAQRKSEAREQARLMREQQERKEKRASFLIKWGVVAAVVAILVIIGLIVVGNIRNQVPDAGSAPAHGNEFGGITLTSTTDLEETSVEQVDVATLPEEANPADLPPGVAASGPDEPVQVVAYVDVNCVHCANFERTHAEQVESWLNEGAITFEYRNVAYLDPNSQTQYSSRGAAALACVADISPEAYWDFSVALFGNFENGELNDGELAEMAQAAGSADISGCLAENTFRPWVKYTTQAGEVHGVGGTPTVFVDGEEIPDPVSDFATVTQEKIDAKN